jgi:hypothetical protein
MADTEKPEKPVAPGPVASEAEHRRHAEENAAWSDWIAAHPEDAEGDTEDEAA